DQAVLLDRNRKRLCDVRPLDEARASFDRHLELPRPYRFGIAPRLTRADVVFPAVPGAAQEFLLARQTVTTRSVRQDERADPSTAQWAAGVWAAIGQREILAVEAADENKALVFRDNAKALYARRGRRLLQE